MRRLILATVAVTMLSGCAPMTFAPGPGMDASNFEPDSAQCRLFARGNTPGYMVVGSQQFVSNYAAGAAIGGAVRQRADYRDCMEAKGWILQSSASPQPTPSPPDATDWQLLRYCASEHNAEPVCHTAPSRSPPPPPGVNADWQLREYCKGERDAHVSQVDSECVGVPDPAN
jgi:Prokaryotic membrane lipoprotein lipid attachment site